jgi:organic radical activating enzyme
MFLKNNIDYSNNSNFMLSGLDLHWSSLCNLKCITCWAGQSSSIAKEQGKPILHTSNQSADVFIDYVINNQYNLKEIYLSGGEPTLINHNLKLLKKLDKNNNGLQIRINTNMMFKNNNKIIEELKKFPNVLFTISADGMQDRFDYIRRGANWKTFVENLESLILSHFKWRVNSTFFVCNSVYLLDTFRFFKKNYSINDFTINQCKGHDYLRARNLSEFLKNNCISQFSLEINQTEDKNLIGQLQNCIKELNNIKTQSYSSYLDNIDNLAGTNWKTTFTELADE